MSADAAIAATPWDARVFGFDTYEIAEVSEAVLKKAATMRGHFTARVDPLASKELLQRHGFYYCDTLIEPHCAADRFRDHVHDAIGLARAVPFGKVRTFAHGAFRHGRFHRDFNIDPRLADARYEAWLEELCGSGRCFGLLHDRDLAGFLCHDGNRIVLHALGEASRGKGLAKFFWSAACRALFAEGHKTLQSSVSVSNMAVVNLYASLGFRFKNPKDIYHRYNP